MFMSNNYKTMIFQDRKKPKYLTISRLGNYILAILVFDFFQISHSIPES